jgi:cell division initiation protein
MELTPNDIRNHKFTGSFRGYNKDEVDAFIESVAAALEDAKVQAMRLVEEKDALERRYQDIKSLEETIKMAVVEAQKASESILANAKKEAELIIAEARRQRDEAIEEKHRKLSEIEAKMEELQFTRRTLFHRLRADMAVTLKLLDSMDPVEKEKDKKIAAKGESPENEIDRIVEQFRKESGAIPFEGSVREEKENKDEL